MTSRFTHVIGFDDAPFDRDDRGDVLVSALSTQACAWTAC